MSGNGDIKIIHAKLWRFGLGIEVEMVGSGHLLDVSEGRADRGSW